MRSRRVMRRMDPKNKRSRIEVLRELFWHLTNFGQTLGKLMHFGSDPESPIPILESFFVQWYFAMEDRDAVERACDLKI